MKIVALLCLALGLFAGPVYWVAAKFFTGSRLAMLDLKPVDAAAGSWRSPDFRLEPGMAPVGLILHVDTLAPGLREDHVTRQNHFKAILSRDGVQASPLGLSQRSSGSYGPTQSFREHLLFLKEATAGRHQLEVVAQGAPELPVTAMRLEVRQHLHEPDSRVVTGGMLLMMLGILTLVAL